MKYYTNHKDEKNKNYHLENKYYNLLSLYRRSHPFGYLISGIEDDKYPATNATIKITQEYVKEFYDENIISGVMFFSVTANYIKGTDYYYFESQPSDEVNVQLYW